MDEVHPLRKYRFPEETLETLPRLLHKAAPHTKSVEFLLPDELVFRSLTDPSVLWRTSTIYPYTLELRRRSALFDPKRGILTTNAIIGEILDTLLIREG